ncbi:MAG: hypothetical protein C0631_18480 [Sedimenticola sp.]|jgi:hypothetical protein|nr:MAG: hypothetical protein C0631_18480 [Sedimenticola sp.]
MTHQQDRRQFWRAHYDRCHQLGLTLKGYAEQEGLTVSVFYGWSKRFKREASATSRFTRVEIGTTGPADYRLRLPNGLVLEWSGTADTAQLARLVKSLA